MVPYKEHAPMPPGVWSTNAACWRGPRQGQTCLRRIALGGSPAFRAVLVGQSTMDIVTSRSGRRGRVVPVQGRPNVTSCSTFKLCRTGLWLRPARTWQSGLAHPAVQLALGCLCLTPMLCTEVPSRPCLRSMRPGVCGRRLTNGWNQSVSRIALSRRVLEIVVAALTLGDGTPLGPYVELEAVEADLVSTLGMDFPVLLVLAAA